MYKRQGGGRLLKRLSNHQKTVTSVSAVDVRDRDGRECIRVVSAALDGHVKVYDLESLKVAYAFKYPAPVTAFALAPSLASMAVGMSDKTLVVRKHRQRGGALTAVGTLPCPTLAQLCSTGTSIRSVSRASVQAQQRYDYRRSSAGLHRG